MSDPKASTAAAAPASESPEFKAAVAAEVRNVLTAFKESGGEGLSGPDRKWAESLALAFASLTEQGSGRKYVAPEIIRMRTEARERMKELIIAARADGRPATYRVVAKTLLDNQVVEPKWVDSHHIAQDTEIDWPSVPNDAMVPINDTAKEIHAAFLESVGSRPQSVLGAVPDAAGDAFGITPGGLVVRGGAINRYVNKPEHATLSQLGDQGLAVHHKTSPGRVVEKRVLGSIAAPAHQTI